MSFHINHYSGKVEACAREKCRATKDGLHFSQKKAAMNHLRAEIRIVGSYVTSSGEAVKSARSA